MKTTIIDQNEHIQGDGYVCYCDACNLSRAKEQLKRANTALEKIRDTSHQDSNVAGIASDGLRKIQATPIIRRKRRTTP